VNQIVHVKSELIRKIDKIDRIEQSVIAFLEIQR
tara:strand:- start:986 stop:1087 length:102 start_codon:yes stop_codon:yes gene_type:complete